MSEPTDFRALCAELVEGIDRHVDFVDDATTFSALLESARAALAAPQQPPGRTGLTWADAAQGLRDVLTDQTEDAIQRAWQRSRILDALELIEANACLLPAPQQGALSDEGIRDIAEYYCDFERFDASDQTERKWLAWECTDAGLINFARTIARWGAEQAAERLRGQPPAPPKLTPQQQGHPHGPIPVDKLRAAWNQQADKFNQWESLGLDEQLAWAQALAVARFGSPAPVPVAPPSGHAYRYRDYHGGTVIRFNSGCEVNGSKPIEAVPYWFAPQAAQVVPVTVQVAVPPELLEIGRRMRTQDNRITADPIFLVRGLQRVYGMDPSTHDNYIWVDTDDSCEECEPPDDEDDPPENIEKCYYTERWVTLKMAFTEEGCREHLRINGHNYKRAYEKVDIYADSLWRMPEMIAIRNFLMSLPEPT